VKAGAPILQIDPLKQTATVNSQEATRKSREANLEWARTQLERTKQLYSSGVASKQDLDQAQTAFNTAQADVASLDAQVREQTVQLKYFTVTAPIDGVIGDVPVHVGDRVTPATVLTTVDQKTAREAYINIPAERIPMLKLGTPVQIVDGNGAVIAATRVTFISPEVDMASQAVLVKAAVDMTRTDLREAQFVRARVIWDSKPQLAVPVTAVSRISGQYFAFVAEHTDKGWVAHQRPLRVGPILGSDYVVLDGLQAGDKLIVSGSQNLMDGAPVVITQ
jgi:RND family efflux transporter MFP subunit